MTVTEDRPTNQQTQAAGRVVRVTGPVVDVEFPRDAMPDLFNALKVEVTLADLGKTLTLEVAQHLGEGVVRTISMAPTDGLVRGAEVTDTGSAISVPVGDVVTGHVWNALGECLDEPGYGAGRRSAGRSTGTRRASTSSRAAPSCWRPASRSSTC